MVESQRRSVVEEKSHESSRDIFDNSQKEDIAVARCAERDRTRLQVNWGELASTESQDH